MYVDKRKAFFIKKNTILLILFVIQLIILVATLKDSAGNYVLEYKNVFGISIYGRNYVRNFYILFIV